MKTLDLKWIEAVQLLSSDNRARRVFNAVTVSPGVSGWSLAKSLNEKPDSLNPLLDQLTSAGVVKTLDAGLDGNYALTSRGWELKEELAEIE